MTVRGSRKLGNSGIRTQAAMGLPTGRFYPLLVRAVQVACIQSFSTLKDGRHVYNFIDDLFNCNGCSSKDNFHYSVQHNKFTCVATDTMYLKPHVILKV